MSSESGEDLTSEAGYSTELGSNAPTQDDDLTVGGTDSALNFGDEASSAGGAETLEQGTEDVAIAVPPTTADGAGEYHEIALTGSAALDLLEQLAANNAIGKEKAAKLRRKYNTLRDTLESSRVMESTLLDRAKTLSHQLAYQRRVLEKGASFPDSSTTHSSHLRQILLSHQNEMDMTEMRINKLNEEAEKLEEDRGLIEKEYHRLPKKEELEQHIKELSKSVEGLNDEISLRSQDLEQYHNDLDKKNFRMTVIRNEIEELRELEDALQQELIDIRNGPNITKEIEIVKRQQKETSHNIKHVEEYLDEIAARISEIEEKTSGMKEECTGTASLLHKQKELIVEREMELNQLGKHLMLGKEREATLLEDKATLEIRLRHRLAEVKSLYEAHVAKTKEKDRELKTLKKVDLQLSSLKQSMEQVERQLTVMEERQKKQLADCKKVADARVEVQTEVTTLRKELQNIEGITDYDRVKLNQRVAVEEATKRASKQLREKLHELNKEILAMTKCRDNESRVYYKAKREERAIVNDIKTKDAYIRDQQKKIREVEAELLDFRAAYEVVKNERNKTHSQILVMQQVSAELAEKTKILANEIEILHTVAAEKEKILQKCSLVHSTKVMERDTQRQEVNKCGVAQTEVHCELRSERESIEKLSKQIHIAEHLLNRLRRRYEQTVQERNDLGLQLIERNEEVCVFYEKLNVQESVIRKAYLKLEAREEELKFLNAELRRIQSEIQLSSKRLPEKEQLEVEMLAAQEELKSCEQELRQLEKAVEDSSDPDRLRLLPGKNPTHNDLTAKMDKVEAQLAESEQQLLEKELLYEQVGKLTDRANMKVDSQRVSTLAVAKKVNNYQAKIKAVTRKMMALVSELSMQQASALRLEQEVKEQESRLQQAYTRLENGEAPDEQAQAEWEKMVQQENRRKLMELEKMKAAREDQGPGGVFTTAEARPTAYIPSGEGDLPVPKPYGSRAPFKPSQAVGNMRHIRKPQPQPIDI